MRCLTCHYDLRNLSENRCPECGREFDPHDPESFDTFASTRSVNKRALRRAFLSLGAIFVGSLIAAFVMNGSGFGASRLFGAAKQGLFVMALAVPIVVMIQCLPVWLEKP